jgi:Fe-S-cluster containining protein
VRVTGDDRARLAERAEDLVWFDQNRAYMRMVEGHCGALRIEPASGRFFCSAYETRPDVCRALARGSSACRAELDAKAQRPVLLLGLHRRALV